MYIRRPYIDKLLAKSNHGCRLDLQPWHSRRILQMPHSVFKVTNIEKRGGRRLVLAVCWLLYTLSSW